MQMTGQWVRRGSTLVLLETERDREDYGLADPPLGEGPVAFETTDPGPQARLQTGSWGYPFDLRELDGYLDASARDRARRARIAAVNGDEDSNYQSFMGLVYRFGFGGHFPVYSRKPKDRDGWHAAVDIPIPQGAVGKLVVRSIGDGVVLGATIDTAYSGAGNGGVIVVVKHTLPDGRSFLVRYVHLHNLLCTELSSEDRKLVPTWEAFRQWSDQKRREWTAWLRGRPRTLPLRAGTKVTKGQPLGPLGFLLSGHHLHLEIISRDVFAGFGPLGTRNEVVSLEPAAANVYRSVRGDTKNAYWGPNHTSSGWIWYHPLHFLHTLQGNAVAGRPDTTSSPSRPTQSPAGPTAKAPGAPASTNKDVLAAVQRWNLPTGLPAAPLFFQLVDRWRPPHLPLPLLVAFSSLEASGWNDATHGTKGNNWTRPAFYELGVFQVPAGLHGLCTSGHHKDCQHPPPGSDPQRKSPWFKICASLGLDPLKWTDPTTQVRVGIQNLETDAATVRRLHPKLFPNKGSDWALRASVLMPFGPGIGYTLNLLKKHRAQLESLPESARWAFLRAQGAVTANVDAKMTRAQKLAHARGTPSAMP